MLLLPYFPIRSYRVCLESLSLSYSNQVLILGLTATVDLWHKNLFCVNNYSFFFLCSLSLAQQASSRCFHSFSEQFDFLRLRVLSSPLFFYLDITAACAYSIKSSSFSFLLTNLLFYFLTAQLSSLRAGDSADSSDFSSTSSILSDY